MEEPNYNVSFEPFAERHFLKSFKKKYKTNWNKTELIIFSVCEHIDKMLQYNRADLIKTVSDYKLVKLDFAVDGSHQSPKAAGNRCILFVDKQLRSVKILLIYSKTDISTHHETDTWKNIIKENYPEISKIFNF